MFDRWMSKVEKGAVSTKKKKNSNQSTDEQTHNEMLISWLNKLNEPDRSKNSRPKSN